MLILCRRCAPKHMEAFEVAVVGGVCAGCLTFGSSPEVNRYRDMVRAPRLGARLSYTTPQVLFINDSPYFGTYALACALERMGRRRGKTWLGRNWRRMRPLVDLGGGNYRFKSGTHDIWIGPLAAWQNDRYRVTVHRGPILMGKSRP